MAFRLSTVALAAIALLSSTCSAAPASMLSPIKRSSNLKFSFGSEKVHGVNLGGWLVLEPWITPSIFEATPESVVDEWTMGQALGATEFKKRQEKHWSTFITEDDFKEIKAMGLNFVRIPIGYWAISPIEGDPYVQGAYEYLGKALGWAKTHGLKVIIDLHGAPGSQNGFDNSGHRGAIDWNQGDTVAQTYTTLNKIRDDHAKNDAVAAIEVLNEPLAPVIGKTAVEAFSSQAYDNLKGAPVAVLVEDAFDTIKSWTDFGKGKSNLILDVHPYQIFLRKQLKFSLAEHESHACHVATEMKAFPSWAIAGEFTGAMTDCAKWLNGRGRGARFDGTYLGAKVLGTCDRKVKGHIDDLHENERQNIKAYIKAQMNAYEKTAGWIYWTWKVETGAAPEWPLKGLAAAGLVPKISEIDGSGC